MNQMIRVYLSRIGKAKIIFLVFISFLFAFSGRDARLSCTLHFVSSISDHYFVLYGFLPLMLVCLFPVLDDDSEIFICRFTRYSTYFTRKWIALGFVSALLIMAELAGILLSGIGLQNISGWVSSTSVANEELFPVLMKHFESPITCFFALILWQFAGVWISSGLLLWIRHFLSKKGTLMMIFIMYLLAALSIKISLLVTVPIPTFNYLLLLHHNFISEHGVYITLSAVAVLVLLILITIRFCPFITIKPTGLSGMPGYYPRQIMTWKNIGIAIGVIGLVSIYKYIQIGDVPFNDMWMLEFYSGHGIGYLQPIPFIEMLILNGAPVYLLASFIQNAVSEQSAFVPIRAVTKRKLMGTHLCIGGLFVAIYCTILFLFPVVRCLFSEDNDASIALKLAAMLCFLKFMDCFVQYLLFLIVYHISRSTLAAFSLIVIGNILAVTPRQFSEWWPLGMSSTARFFEEQNIFAAIEIRTLILSGIVLVLSLYLLKFGKERITQ